MPGALSVRRRAAYIPPVPAASNRLSQQPYNPASAETKTVTDTAGANFDATNLILPAFEVPDTGAVYAVLNAMAWSGGAAPGAHGAWAIRNGSGEVFPALRIHQSIQRQRQSLWHYIDGLTPGQTISDWTWGAHPSSTDGQSIICGGDEGPALMQVWKAATLLDRAILEPSENFTRQSTSIVNVDAALSCTFTVPASGEVFYCLYAYAEGGGQICTWGVREGTNDPPVHMLMTVGTTSGHPQRHLVQRRVTGLTPAASVTWDWCCVTGSTAMTFHANAGPMVMEVWGL